MLLVGLCYRGWVFPFETFRCVWIPNIFAMAQRGVKDSSTAVLFRPGDWIFSWSFLVRMFVQHQQGMNFCSIKAFHKIDLIFDMKPGAEMLAGRVFGIFIDTIHLSLGTVCFKLTA